MNKNLEYAKKRRERSEWALFVDRDGTLNTRIDGAYVTKPDELEMIEGASRALGALSAWAPYTVVVTNQQGVGKGLLSQGDLGLVHQKLLSEVQREGAIVRDILVCPHLAEKGCECRKPEPGLALEWLEKHPEVDGALSIMVGDAASDVEMAKNLANQTGGCLAISVGNDSSSGDFHFPSLLHFALELELI